MMNTSLSLQSSRGGYRANAGRKSSWRHQPTCTLGIPKTFAPTLLEPARRLDAEDWFDFDTQSNESARNALAGLLSLLYDRSVRPKRLK